MKLTSYDIAKMLSDINFKPVSFSSIASSRSSDSFSHVNENTPILTEPGFKAAQKMIQKYQNTSPNGQMNIAEFRVLLRDQKIDLRLFNVGGSDQASRQQNIEQSQKQKQQQVPSQYQQQVQKPRSRSEAFRKKSDQTDFEQQTQQHYQEQMHDNQSQHHNQQCGSEQDKSGVKQSQQQQNIDKNMHQQQVDLKQEDLGTQEQQQQIEEENRIIHQIFKEYDQDNLGLLTFSQLKLLLHQHCSNYIDDSVIRQIFQCYKEYTIQDSNENRIGFENFLKMIDSQHICLNVEKNPTEYNQDRIESIPKILLEQKSDKSNDQLKIFHFYDKDRDGYLNHDELFHLLQQQSLRKYHERYVRQIMQKYANAKDKFGLLSQQKFLQMLKEQKIPLVLDIYSNANSNDKPNNSILSVSGQSIQPTKRNSAFMQQSENLSSLYEDLFKMYDVDRDGYLNFKELKEFCGERISDSISDGHVNSFILHYQRLRNDKRNDVDFLEFKDLIESNQFTVKYNTNTEHEQKEAINQQESDAQVFKIKQQNLQLLNLFNKIDSDHDGKLSFEQVKELLTLLETQKK